MKIFYTLALSFFFLISCNESGKRDKSLLPASAGNINSLQIIMPNDLWNGEVGGAVRDHFAAPTDGLPQDEPLFSIKQMPPEAFSGFARYNRIFLYVSIGEDEKVSLAKDEFSKPQTGAFIKAATSERLVELIEQNSDKIIEAFHKAEILERQKRTAISTLKADSLKTMMGVELKMPSAYRMAKAEKNFFWFRKDLKNGSTVNILVYEAQLNLIRNDSTAIGDIIKIRDSIGSKLLPVEDDALFITEDAYAPYIRITEVDGKKAYETKGTWELKDEFMGGPFLNYAVLDEKNNRYLILEGFTYAPAERKRDLQFEVESILLSAKIE